MEARPTRRALRAFPADLEFTQDPKDPLRAFLDAPGRQMAIASEFIGAQMENLFLSTADLNEPSRLYNSGVTVDLNAVFSGHFVPDMQDLATMEVTGFDLIQTIRPCGITGNLRGISYAQDPATSGTLYLGVNGSHTIYTYDWGNLNALKDTFLFAVETQSFLEQGEDEYLAIQREGNAVFAHLKHTPRGTVRVVDTRNLQAPWDPSNSDGIVVPAGEITVSGSTLFFTNPRPSYSPALKDGTNVTYPTDYQPDRNWDSVFIAEYDYETQEAPYGLSQPSVRHNMGLAGRPLGGSDAI